MEILETLFNCCSTQVNLLLITADLIPQLITSLNPQCLSFEEAVDIHSSLMRSLRFSILLPNVVGPPEFEIEDDNEQQHAYETVLKHVIVPSENLLAPLLRICPYYQPTMEFVLHTPSGPDETVRNRFSHTTTKQPTKPQIHSRFLFRIPRQMSNIGHSPPPSSPPLSICVLDVFAEQDQPIPTFVEEKPPFLFTQPESSFFARQLRWTTKNTHHQYIPFVSATDNMLSRPSIDIPQPFRVSPRITFDLSS
ncbi:hypothetical protein BLNAU_4041 [Blattamonas nauphoetae]|uniref:Uncharacterized protein n=1 Tax=Blattamonas nauphoetae TaxID=2049346 RepID=A0ABQ9YB60_9EUKA|nr:hypothetical protein BLNAU_4041 [Blattamonas nauphoetae]